MVYKNKKEERRALATYFSYSKLVLQDWKVYAIKAHKPTLFHTAPRCSTLRCWHSQSDPCGFTLNTTLPCCSIYPLLLLQLHCVISLDYARLALHAIATCLQTSPVPGGPAINALRSDARPYARQQFINIVGNY